MRTERLATAIRNAVPEAPKDWLDDAIAAAIAVPHEGDDDAWHTAAVGAAVETLQSRLAAQRTRIEEVLAALALARLTPYSDTVH